MKTFSSYSRRFVRPLWGWYAGGFLLLAAVNLVNLEIPQLAKGIINKLAAGADVSGTEGTALAIVGLGFLMIVIRGLSRIVIFWPGRVLETRTKSTLFDKTLRLTQEFYLRHGMGDLISRLANDVGQLRAFFAFGLLQLLNVAFLLIFTIYQMASVHGTLTLLALLPLVAMLAITRVSMPKMHHQSRANQMAIGSLTNRVTEAFVNVHVLQANAAQPSFLERASKENEEVYATNVKLVMIRTLIFPLMTCLSGLSQLVVLFYGGHEVIAGRLTVGDILAFNVYIALLSFPLTAMGMILAMYQRARTALERIGEIDEAQDEAARPECAVAAGSRAGASPHPLLEVRGLAFRYPSAKAGDAPRFGLEGIDLALAPGRRIGLFGKVGAGKSTLFNVLTRLYDPPPGTVFLDGQDILALDPPALRRRIGYALQSVHLFSDTIRANLAFGLPEVPPEPRLRAAAAGAQILPEIEAFRDGWDTQIGEKGVRLSGGQKQRLALARLFVRDLPVLLLDDVLSAVDHTTERRLVDYIHSLGCALIIASHRGSALKDCDEILVLSEGRIVDRGPYSQLVPRWPDLSHDA
jgi:ATP-binding cassette subfamily B protein